LDTHSPEGEYFHSILLVEATFVLFIIALFITFVIFMNFIIAMINHSYSKINNSKLSYDYSQRIIMIYEREVRFTEKDFRNDVWFPSILVVLKQ
jgi:hypothetical protein